ncbi:S-fimbrial protein subunit SfaG precursor [Serratia quinivorans]|jgi:type 1 fimbria pilin|uniref:fimbrial protein n=1 Tax=Serratia quinivorans TaxID=137545 RepID=UPI00217C39A5|nr:fimbrial protein [Serratia quinivorans]CAI1567510.1 S-fimbrial protein subunit SfaG precursor [Serratia quinivorans]CAI1695662.1 S-fimbrial protein subunit SfaG precursor [Serratia quinivorans]CAI1724919.1 S-fimbrial protein subunit SfaG precursor [Serratia quinivorans]
MKKLALMFIVLVCGMPAGYCVDGIVMLQVNAIVSLGSCDVDPGSEDQDIDLGTISNTEFTKVGDVSSSTKTFTVQLQNCEGNFNYVTTAFSGVADAGDSTLLGLSANSSAQGIGIQILDTNGNPLDITQPVLTRRTTTGLLTYQLRYKATEVPVQPGTANGTLFLNFYYQ